MIYLVFRNENSYKIWYTNSSFQELISSACYRFTYKIWGIDTYLPREGTETKNNLVSKELFLISIDTYLPREGPETCILFIHTITTLSGISTYLPREGPETEMRGCKSRQSPSIATYLPREGPATFLLLPIVFLELGYRYLSTSRGAGNHALNFGIIPNPRIAPYLPR